MKNLLFLFSFLTFGIAADAQVVNKILGDRIRMYQTGGAPAELQLENATRGLTGAFLRNTGNGLSEWAYAVDDVWQEGPLLKIRRGPNVTSLNLYVANVSISDITGLQAALDAMNLQKVTELGNTTRLGFLVKSSNTGNTGTLVKIGEVSPTQGEIQLLNTNAPDRLTLLQPGYIRSNVFQFQTEMSGAGGAVGVSYFGSGYYTQNLQAKNGDIALLADIPTNNASLTNGAGYITAAALTPFLTVSSAAATYQPLLGYTAENAANKATSFGTLNNTLYPTTQAVATYVSGLGYLTTAGAASAYQPLLGYTAENTANKATSFTTVNHTLFPTTQAVATYVTGLGYLTSSALAPYATSSAVAAGYFPLAGGSITGAAGAGFLGLPSQTSAPTGVSGTVKIYADASGRLSWITGLGFSRTFTSGALTGNRLYTLTDLDGIVMTHAAAATAGQVPYYASADGLTQSSALTFSGSALAITGSQTLSGTLNASGGIARSLYVNHTLSATANNDYLVGLDINNTVSMGTFLNVNSIAMRIQGGNVVIGSATPITGMNTNSLQVSGNAGFTGLAGTGQRVVFTDATGTLVGGNLIYNSPAANALTWWGGSNASSTTNTFKFVIGSNTVQSYAALNIRGGIWTGDNGDVSSLGASSSTSGIGYIWRMTNGLKATANSDMLYGLDLAPTFYPQSFTGVKYVGLRIGSGSFVSNGGRTVKRATYTAAVTLSTNTDHYVTANTSAGGFTITLPAGTDGDEYFIRHSSGSSNTLTIASSGGATITGAASPATLASGSVLHLVYNSSTTNWEQY